MSNIYRLVAFTTFVGINLVYCNAQSRIDKQNPVFSAFYFVERSNDFPKDPKPSREKAPGTVLFSANFANSLGSWTTTGTNGALWQHDDDGPSGQFSVAANEIINSQSVNNGFAIFDADLSNPGPGPWQARSGALVSPSFSMTGVSFAFVEFFQKYRFCCDASFIPKLEVSSNNFETFATFDASIPNVGVGMISPTHLSKINITPFLDTATDLSSVKIRFNFQGNSQATHYYWQIDDIKVKEAYLYDLNIENYAMGMGQMQLPYYFLPFSQLSPITFYGSVVNEGSMESGNVRLEVNLNLGGGSTTSDPLLLQPMQSESFTSYALTPPLVWNSYTVTYEFVQDSIEGYPNDNSSTELLSVFDHLYSVDNNEGSGYISNVQSQPGQAFKVGNVMEVLKDDAIDSMHVFVTGTQSNVGQEIYGELRKKVNGIWQQIGVTEQKLITWENYTTSIGLRFTNILTVEEGDTLLVLSCHNGGGSEPDVRFKQAQTVEMGLVQGYTANGTLFTLDDPHALMVRLNMNSTLKVNNLESSTLRLFPNPFRDQLLIDNFKEGGELRIFDFNGKEMHSQSIDNNEKIILNTEGWSSGVYSLSFVSDTVSRIERVVKL